MTTIIYYGVIDFNKNLVFESTSKTTAKYIANSYEGSYVIEYGGSAAEHIKKY